MVMIKSHIDGNFSFRRTLKHIHKQGMRVSKHSIPMMLANYGLAGNYLDLIHALKHNVKGRYYYRLGQAALKKNCMVSIMQITFCVIHHRDLREIPFIAMPIPPWAKK